MIMEDLTRCPSCGVRYASHPGLIPTCRELLEARQWQEYLLKSNAELEAQRNNANTERDRYKKELDEIQEYYCKDNNL